MKTILDLHDNQILKIVSNPIIGSLQLIITYGSDKILEIYISEIKKIIQENIECISLFFESAGGLDQGFIEEKESYKKLFLSGIIDRNQKQYENVNWSFCIEAKKISLKYLVKTTKEIDDLMDQGKLDIC